MSDYSNIVSVPWISTPEWCHVKTELFSGIPSKQRHAIERIDAWRIRAPRSLPVSIISTVDLMRLALKDQEQNHEVADFSTSHDDTQLRLAYSMALVRFVNISTEMLQKKTAQAVHILAVELGLPEWLVNIRHEATHYSMPSMDLLRNGVSVALEWLKITYWDEQAKDINLANFSRASVFGETDLGENLNSRLSDVKDRDCCSYVWESSKFPVDWSRVPLGILPGQSLSYHSLELTESVDKLRPFTSPVDIPSLSYHFQDCSDS